LGTAALAYNALLGVIVLFYFFRAYLASKAIPTLDSILGLFLPAVLANVAYCGASIADGFAQWSSYHDLWRRYRWVLFCVGMLFAAHPHALLSECFSATNPQVP
jgi:Na+-translocating ferredoxin:NAD+ oxidoreductase RnfA subunit